MTPRRLSSGCLPVITWLAKRNDIVVFGTCFPHLSHKEGLAIDMVWLLQEEGRETLPEGVMMTPWRSKLSHYMALLHGSSNTAIHFVCCYVVLRHIGLMKMVESESLYTELRNLFIFIPQLDRTTGPYIGVAWFASITILCLTGSFWLVLHASSMDKRSPYYGWT